MDADHHAATEAVTLARAKVAIFSSDLPQPVLNRIEIALREGGCEKVEMFSNLDEVVSFDCSQPGCPAQVDPRITGTSLVFIDWKVAGVPGLELLGALRTLPEAKNAKVIMIGPHGRDNHRSIRAAWSFNVDCYLTRDNFLNLEETELARLARYTKALLGTHSAVTA
jgi:hypothetical protein